MCCNKEVSKVIKYMFFTWVTAQFDLFAFKKEALCVGENPHPMGKAFREPDYGCEKNWEETRREYKKRSVRSHVT